MAKNSTTPVYLPAPSVLRQRIIAWVQRLAFTLAAITLLPLTGRSAGQGTTAVRHASTTTDVAHALRTVHAWPAGSGSGIVRLPRTAIATAPIAPRSPLASTRVPGLAPAFPAGQATDIAHGEPSQPHLAPLPPTTNLEQGTRNRLGNLA